MTRLLLTVLLCALGAAQASAQNTVSQELLAHSVSIGVGLGPLIGSHAETHTQHKRFAAVLRGHYGYYGRPHSYPVLIGFYREA